MEKIHIFLLTIFFTNILSAQKEFRISSQLADPHYIYQRIMDEATAEIDFMVHRIHSRMRGNMLYFYSETLPQDCTYHMDTCPDLFRILRNQFIVKKLRNNQKGFIVMVRVDKKPYNSWETFVLRKEQNRYTTEVYLSYVSEEVGMIKDFLDTPEFQNSDSEIRLRSEVNNPIIAQWIIEFAEGYLNRLPIVSFSSLSNN